MDFQNEIEDDYKHNEANVRTARSDWAWVMMTFQKDIGTNNRNNQNMVSFLLFFYCSDLEK